MEIAGCNDYDIPLINVGTNRLCQANNQDLVWKSGGTKEFVLEEVVAAYIEDSMESQVQRGEDHAVYGMIFLCTVMGLM